VIPPEDPDASSTPSGSEPRPAEVPVPPIFTGKAAFAFRQLHYYIVAIVAVGFVIAGAFATLIAVRQLALPAGSDTTRESARALLAGLAILAPAVVLFAWHFREGRRGDERFFPGKTWSGVLYAHVVALASVFVAFAGAMAALRSTVDLILPRCFNAVNFASPSNFKLIGGVSDSPLLSTDSCFPSHGDAARSIVNGLIILVVGGAVFLWHIRLARRDEQMARASVR
jgi:hypothetical protein